MDNKLKVDNKLKKDDKLKIINKPIINKNLKIENASKRDDKPKMDNKVKINKASKIDSKLKLDKNQKMDSASRRDDKPKIDNKAQINEASEIANKAKEDNRSKRGNRFKIGNIFKRNKASKIENASRRDDKPKMDNKVKINEASKKDDKLKIINKPMINMNLEIDSASRRDDKSKMDDKFKIDNESKKDDIPKIDNKPKIIKEKFKLKLEIEKRKVEFDKIFQALRKAQKEVLNKNKALKELIKQEKKSQKQKVDNSRAIYKREIQNQRQEIIKHRDLINRDRTRFKETALLEKAKLKQEILNQRLKSSRDLRDARKQTKKLILENRKTIRNIRQENQKAFLEQKTRHDKQKVESAKSQTTHLENLAKQRKEFEMIKRQHVLVKFNLHKELKEAQKKRMLAQRNQKHDIEMQIQKEKNSLELDLLRMRNEDLSYSNLLKRKKGEAKISAEKLKFEADKLKQEQKLETIRQAGNITSKVSLHKLQTASFINDDYQSKESLVDKKTLPLQINLKNDTIKGIVISEVGKRALKVFEKLNFSDTSHPLEKAKISQAEKLLIEKARKLKSKNALVPINDYVQLASFMVDKEIDDAKIQGIIVSVIYNMIKGKALSFLGGYFSVVYVRGYRKIVYSEAKTKLSRFSIINLPESKLTNEFEKLLAQKLNDKPFIRIAENIVLTNIDSKIKVITDMAFMR